MRYSAWSAMIVCSLMALVAAAPVWALETLPLDVTPAADAQVTAGRTFPLTIDTPGDTARLRVQVAGTADSGVYPQEKEGSPPLEFDLTVREVTGPFEILIVATNYDPQTEVVKSTATRHRLFSVPDPTEAPATLEVRSKMYLKAPAGEQSGEKDVVSPMASYADGRRRGVRFDAFGITYASNAPSIATVDGDGLVAAVSPGVAYITTEYLGVRGFTQVSVDDPVTGHPPPIEYTEQVSLNRSGFQRDPKSGLYVQQVSFVNQTEWPIPQPIYLMVTDLTQGVESVDNPGPTDKIEPLGSPAIRVQISEGARFLSPGATETAVLYFRNNNNLASRSLGRDRPAADGRALVGHPTCSNKNRG